MSKAYEIYKTATGGKTFDGTPMKPFDILPDYIKDAWIAIDKTYTEKKPKVKKDKPELPINCKEYEEFAKRTKNSKSYCDLPDQLKKMWLNIEKNKEKFVVPKPEPVKKEKKNKKQ